MSEHGWTAAGDFQLPAHARTLLESTDEGMLSLDLRGRCTFVNSAARRMLGYEREEILGEELHPLVHHSRPDGSPYPEEECPVYRAFRIGESCRVEDEVFWRRDRSPFPVEYSSRPIVVGGQITGAVVTFFDITERKHAEEELRKSHRRTENVVESITDAFVAVDRQWRYTYVNERALRRMRARKDEAGLTREKVLGKNMWELFPEAVDTTIYHRYHEAVREQKTVEFETYFPPSGEWIESHAYPSEDGLSVYYRDVTERKRAEERLRRSNRRTEEILESITDGFYAMDQEWRFTYLNARAVRFASQLAGVEFTREGLLGRTLWETLPAIVGTTIEEQYRRAVREQQTAIFEYTYPGGGPYFEVHAYPSDQGLSIYFRDVTGRKRADEERERLLQVSESRTAELDATIQSMPDAVYIGNENGISVCNDVALEMLGFGSIAELNHGIPILSERLQNRFVRTGERIPPEEEPFARALKGETVVQEVVARHLKTGRDVFLRCAAAPVWSEGRIIAAVAVNSDVTARKQAEEQRAYHARLLENVNDAVLATDERYVLTAWNKGAEQMYGWTADEALGRNVGEVLRSEITEGRRTRILRELAETGRYRYELPMYHKNGTPIYVEGVIVALRGERDRISGYLSINRDISERKRAEEELRESEIFVRSTLNSLSAHIAILDETGLILATNRAWQGFTEANPPVTASAGAGSNYLEICDAATGEEADEAAAFARGIRGVISGRRDSFEMEYPCHSPEERRWFVGRVTRFTGTHPPKVVVAHENVTERQLAMEEIELRAHQQEAVANLGRRALSGPDLTDLMDEAIEVVARTLNVEFCKILELLPEGDDLLLRAGVGWKRELVGTATEKAGTGSQAGYTLLADGPVILEDLSSETRFERTALLREHGVVSGVSTVIRGYEEPFGVLGAHTKSRRDFTENDVNFLRAVANVLGEAIEWRRAEERMGEVREAERGRMARDLHDGPLQDLTYALTAAQLAQSLSRDEKLNHWLDGTIEALKRTGQELRAAVHDLRLEEQRGRPFPELVKYLVELNRRMVPDREIQLYVADEFPDSPFGENDTELLRILQEALTNTRRHSGARSVVVGLGVDEGGVWTQVEDDGRGFGPGIASGIGLKSMRERARALGGDLRVEGWPGRGARVRFAAIPVSADRRGGAKTVHEGQIRVLLVEDHASFRDAAAAVFEREPGFRVSGQAGTFAGARELIDGGSLAVDVAIVDLGLPDGYGGDLIRELRETNPEAQVLVLSATLDRAEIARAVEAGAAGVLHKSAGMDEVLDAVERLLAGETLMPLDEVVEMLRLAASHRDEGQDARQAIARLTPRELEVLEALGEGLDGKEIARRLRISDKTERNHMASIMAKLGVHSRLQTLIFALRHGAADVR